jgi:hypothetical protein
MISFAGVVAVLAAKTAVQSLIRGQAPGRDEWASVATELLESIVRGQSATEEALGRVEQTLSRIEQKVDHLVQQQFWVPFKTALDALRYAQLTRWEDRAGRLRQAQSEFQRAAAGAPDPFSKALAEWYLAMCFLVDREPLACLTALESARNNAFRSLLESRQRWFEPNLEEIQRRMAKRGLPPGRRKDKERAEATEEIRKELTQVVRASRELAQGVQAIRRALGLAASACAPPMNFDRPIAGFTVLAAPPPPASVRLYRGWNDVLGFRVKLDQILLFPTLYLGANPSGSSNLPAGSEGTWNVSGLISIAFPASAPLSACKVELHLISLRYSGNYQTITGVPGQETSRVPINLKLEGERPFALRAGMNPFGVSREAAERTHGLEGDFLLPSPFTGGV